ncbi:MAG: glycine--tRNA ligase subunit beta [Pseudomonadota bacterium]
MSERSLLLEIGCEELPSSSLKDLGEALERLMLAKLSSLRLSYAGSHWFATPRRIAVRIDALAEHAPAEHREALGPPVVQARDEAGDWTRAAQGFAKKQGVSTEDLEVISTPKGERLGVRQTVPGARVQEALPGLVEELIAELPIAKRMRWGSSRLEFARPIQWLVAIYGEESDFGSVLGMALSNRSRGHRFHSGGDLVLGRAESYEAQLYDARVIADFSQRKQKIREQVHRAAESLGAHALIDEDLLIEVTSLVEWPVALAGSFDEEFLDVPQEALISSMQSHQKYFPVVNDEGALLPNFVTVANIDSSNPASVVAGNERVIRPRLADAAFFFKQDLEHSLASRLDQLDDVVFQAQLGSLGDKSRRLARLAARLAVLTGGDDGEAHRAGLLSKADLVSEMVLEFADLQGIAGGHYAHHDGEAPAICEAIAQHYWPLQAGSPLPEGETAVAVALADRLDTLVGIFGIGQKPSGSRDPFGLRRSSIAVLRLLIEKDLDLDLRELLATAAEAFPPDVIAEDAVSTALDYTFDRLPALFEAEQVPIELFRAVRASGTTRPRDFVLRLEALRAFVERPEAAALAAANKRVGNILAKAGEINSSKVSADLLREPAEKELVAAIDAMSADNSTALRKTDYAAVLSRLATLRDTVDQFFDTVMVNAEDPQLRANRLTLLANLRGEFTAVADISLLAG